MGMRQSEAESFRSSEAFEADEGVFIEKFKVNAILNCTVQFALWNGSQIVAVAVMMTVETR